MRVRPMLRSVLAILTLVGSLGLATVAAAQETTGALQGLVTMKSDKSPLPGVTVEALHVPTGTRYTAITGANGRFSILNVRVGGPYTVTAKIGGFRTESIKDVTVALGERRYLGFEMDVQAVTESVTVTAEAEPLISPSRMGAAESISDAEIKALPSIRRQFQDYAKTNPYVNAAVGDATQTQISFSGKNNRYNTIQIDGAVNNDLFGLAATGTPGGQTDTQPISLESIQELQVAVSPYDIRQGGFTGGAINAITKSGTNEFHGSAYGWLRNQGFTGKNVPQATGDALYRPLASYDSSQWGASLGAPIVKDRLFFFGSGEMNKLSAPTGASANGTATNNYKDPAQAAAFQQLLINKYGFNPGGLGDYNTLTTSNLIFGRLDFNANDSNQVTFRYNYVDAGQDSTGGTRGFNTYTFESSKYTIADKTNSMVLQVNSVFGTDSFNQGRVGYQTIRDQRSVPQPFPSVYICNTPNSACTGNNTWQLLAGTERSSGANSLDQDILEVTDDYTLITGNHTITIGTHNEFFKFSNLFIQDVYGTYFFSSVADLDKGVAGRYQVQFANGADPRRPTQFAAQQWGLYVGDQWRVSERLMLNLGLRFDLPRLPDSPTYNPLVYNTFGVNTSEMPNSMGMISPRLGFNWGLDAAGKSQLRGGIGVFAGRTPFVWISNNYGNTGVEITNLSATNVTFNPDPNNPPKNFPPGTAAITVNGIDPSFKFPQVLRSMLGYDRELPYGIRFTVEGMFTKTLKDIFYYNINKVPTGAYTWYGAPIYKNYSTAFSDMVYLSNTNRGEQQDVVVQLQKRFNFGLNVSGSYAYMKSKAGYEGTSSVAYSNWQFQTTNGDIYTQQLTRSFFEVRDRIALIATETFRTGPVTHTVGLYYNGQSGQPYSVLMGSSGASVNGDGTGNNDLLWVPGNYNDVVWKGAGAPTEADWNTFLSATGLGQYQGRVMMRNGLTSPWINTLDFHYDFNIPIWATNLQLSVDILNIINLIDKNSGLIRYVSNQTYMPITYSGIDAATGKPIYTVNSAGALTDGRQYTTSDLRSRWQLKFGARLSF